MDCHTCEDGRYECPLVCPFIPPGSTREQAMAELVEQEDGIDG